MTKQNYPQMTQMYADSCNKKDKRFILNLRKSAQSADKSLSDGIEQ